MSTAEQSCTSPNLPRRRGKAAATLELERAILDIVAERAPLTVRGICYALFTQGLIANMSVGNTARISRIATAMREAGALDWAQIVDGSRVVDRVDLWNNPDEIIRSAICGYRRDHWRDQPVLIELWAEKATVHGILQPVLDELGVAFRVMKGFCSYTTLRQAAEDSLGLPADRDGLALYLGDWDPSGLYMSEVDIPARLARYGSRWAFRRIALTRDDLDHLPYFDAATKAGDARARWYLKRTTADPRKCWELDAMDPNTLRQRVRDSITAHMDADAWRHSLMVEQSERESLQHFHREWSARLRGAR